MSLIIKKKLINAEKRKDVVSLLTVRIINTRGTALDPVTHLIAAWYISMSERISTCYDATSMASFMSIAVGKIS